MKRLWLRVAAGLVGLGILSGVSAAVTIHLFYQPSSAGALLPTAAVPEPVIQQAGATETVSEPDSVGGTPDRTAPITESSPATVQAPGPRESVAAEPPPSLPAGTPLTEGALALIRDLPNQVQSLAPSLVKLAPQPIRAVPLPGTTEQTGTVLVWATYTRPDGSAGTGPLQVRYQEGRPISITGPLVPPGGYARPSLSLLDERSRRLSTSTYEGKPLLLIAPRRPTARLGYTLTTLHEALAPHGVTVALVIDVGAPDWISAARKEGFTGPIWRLKGQLDRVPVVTPGLLDGAVGIMVDKDGYAVGSLPLLDPTAYDLFDKEPAQIAVQVLRAYGLIN